MKPRCKRNIGRIIICIRIMYESLRSFRSRVIIGWNRTISCPLPDTKNAHKAMMLAGETIALYFLPRAYSKIIVFRTKFQRMFPRRRRHLKHLTGAAFNDATQAKRSVDHAHWMEYVRSQRCGDNAPLFPQKKPGRLYRIKTRSRNVA